MLFECLPEFPPALPDDELACLNGITAQPPGEWDMLEPEEWRIAQRLERRGLVKISRSCGELWAQRTQAANLRLAN